MNLTWTDPALADLAGIFRYYSDEAGAAVANRQISKITKAGALLLAHPRIGHKSDIPELENVLEWVIPRTHYILPYRIKEDEIQIIRVFDTRQKRPDEWSGHRS